MPNPDMSNNVGFAETGPSFICPSCGRSDCNVALAAQRAGARFMEERARIERDGICEEFKRNRFKNALLWEGQADKEGCDECEILADALEVGPPRSVCPTCHKCFKYHHE